MARALPQHNNSTGNNTGKIQEYFCANGITLEFSSIRLVLNMEAGLYIRGNQWGAWYLSGAEI